MAEQTVTLNPGQARTLAFESVPQQARTYQVIVDGLTGSFIAREAAPPEPSQQLRDMFGDLYITLWNIRHGNGNNIDNFEDYGWGHITYNQAAPLLKQAMIDEAISLGIISSGSDCYFSDAGHMYHLDGTMIV